MRYMMLIYTGKATLAPCRLRKPSKSGKATTR